MCSIKGPLVFINAPFTSEQKLFLTVRTNFGPNHTKIKQTKPRIGPEQGKSPGSLNTAPGHKLNPTLCVEKHFRIFC